MEPRQATPPSGALATRAVQASLGHVPVEQRPVSPAIWPASTWIAERSTDLGDLLEDRRDGYVYGRYDNPTNTALHRVVAALHDAESAWALSSGTAAIHAAIEALRGDGRILSTTHLYGGTYALLERQAARAGWQVDRVDLSSADALARSLTDEHTVVYAETIANPSTVVLDLAALAEVCRDRGVALVVDNTFASPWLCQPLTLGATAVVESATKYLGGHGDVVAGVVAGSHDLVAAVRELTFELGAALGPFEAWLVARGAQTLPLRMRQSCTNAEAVVQALSSLGLDVRHPTLASHPQHEVAQRLLGGHGGAVLAVDLGDREVAESFVDALELFATAVSLGATHSLALHPASTTHRQLSADALEEAGIPPGLVRMAVGIEDPDDLVADVRAAADAVGLGVASSS